VYDNRVAPLLSYYTYVTRGNKFKLQNHSFNHNFRKFFFSARIVNIWNSLPNYIVDVQSIDVFKVRLDKFWAQQEVMFDWTADLTGTETDQSTQLKVIRLVFVISSVIRI